MSGAAHAIADGEFIAFDLETTGLRAGTCQIVEMAAVRFRGDGTEVARYQRLVNPQCCIPRQAARIHGITDAMVCGQPTIAQLLPEFLEFLGQEDTPLLAHNAAFDVGFISADLARLGLPAPPHQVFDTLAFARRRLPHLSSHRLDSVAACLGVPSGRHRALTDSLTVKESFLRMAALPPDLRAWTDLSALGKPRRFRDAPPGTAAPKGEQSLALAIERRQRITIVYDGGTKGPQQRPITPRRIVQTQGVSYLVAFCHLDAMEKTYRLDRIRELSLAE